MGRIVVVHSIDRDRAAIVGEQDGLCTVVARGVQDGMVVDEARLLTCFSRALSAADAEQWSSVLDLATSPELKIILSNTTEAGIFFGGEVVPSNGMAPTSFPGKLCQVLYARWQGLGCVDAPGLAIIPCELIEDNGRALCTAVLAAAAAWGLPPSFCHWVQASNAFCDTLVDRIVPGAPKQEIAALADRLGYEDRLLTIAEPYHLWAIRAPTWVQQVFPLDQVGNVVWTDDLPAYRVRKVRVLNGAHTAMATMGLLAGLETVGDVMADVVVGGAILKFLHDEVMPTLAIDDQYVQQVLDRFRNPFIRHQLTAISLNATAKWRVRLLPTLRDNLQAGRASPRIIASLASLIQLAQIWAEMKDEPTILDAWTRQADADVAEILGDATLWGSDLRSLGVTNLVTGALTVIRQRGIHALLQELP